MQNSKLRTERQHARPASSIIPLLLSFGLTIFGASLAGAQFYPVGDLNGDRDVDGEDLSILAAQWLNPVCLIPGCEADLDGTGGVNIADLSILAESWGTKKASIVINEFMASNNSSPPLEEWELLDEDDESSDWIEIYNPTDEPVNLSDWCLVYGTANNRKEWHFPAVQLDPGQFRIIFASDKNKTGEELHTNFKLDASGDYLALVKSDGVTVAHEYSPQFPRQAPNISYGLAQYATKFVAAGDSVSYRVPTVSDANASWTALLFDDSGWKTGRTGIGFGNAMPGFKVTYYKANITVDSLSAAESVVGNPSYRSSTASAVAATINYLNTESYGHYTGDLPFPSTTIGNDVENFVVLATGAVLIPQTGYWTFGVNSDDGFELKLTKGDKTFITSYPSPRGPDDTITPFNVTEAGLYNLRLVFYECGGGSELELFAARGSFTTFNSTNFRLVGNTAAGGLSVSIMSEEVATDIQQQMQNVNATLWMRAEFQVEETDLFDRLTLQVKYKDAFAAYLNGQEVARSSLAPATLRWDSSATGVHDVNKFENFDISKYADSLRDGMNVLAIHALNNSKGDGKFMILPELIGASNYMTPQYFAAATPGKFNISGEVNFVADTQFDHDRGFYDTPFSVAISCETEGATIHYTLDGSVPSELRGYEYTGPIPISKTMCLRAMAFKPGWISTNIDTQTYIFLSQVIRQPNNPAGFPSVWGSTAADYEMDQDIVTPNIGTIMDDLMSIPTMSLVMDVNDLFSASGIYSNPWSSGFSWERPGSLELFYPDGSDGFGVNCGVRIYGGVGRDPSFKKHTFRLMFKRNYGPTKLKYPLFGEDAADEFDTLILRSNFNDAYVWGGTNVQYIRDEFARRIQLALGHPSAHGTFVHLFVNGLYWGLYNPTERPESSFAATYFGGDKEDWDALNSGNPIGESSTATWNEMMTLVNQGLGTNESYQHLQGNNPDGTPNPAYKDYLDIGNYIDYMITNLYIGNTDWPGHNWYAAMNRVDTTGFKCFSWDAEWIMGMGSGLGDDKTGVSGSICEPYARLRANPEFRLLFGDHIHKAFFNGGPLYVDASSPLWNPAHPERNRPAAVYAELANFIERSMIAETARWGDLAAHPPCNINQWRSQRDWILYTYMPQRSAIVLGQFRGAGLYPTVNAPEFLVNGIRQHGGQISTSDVLLIGAPSGTIYYTTDGTDPRVPTWWSPPGNVVTLVPENANKRVLIPSVTNGGNLLSNVLPQFQVIYYKANITVDTLAKAESVISNPAYQVTTATEQASVINYFNTGSPGHYDNDRAFPGTVINTDVEHFVILATGKVYIPQTGYWTFGVNSDDGFELRLTKGTKTFTCSYPDPRGPGDTFGPFNITEAGVYDVRLIFYECGGGSELELFAAQGNFSGFSPTDFHLVGDVGAGGLQLGDNNIWFTNYFNDGSWTSCAGSPGGVGYDTGTGFDSYITLDVQTQMFNQNDTCYIRIPFTAGNSEYKNMILKMRYDDGFIAYLNGAEVARRNFTGTPGWNSSATGTHPNGQAIVFEEIDVSGKISALRQGSNVLAIHGLNNSGDRSDFLISAELVATEVSQGAVSPAAFRYTGPFKLSKSTLLKARALDGKWSALCDATFAIGPVADNLRITEIMYHPQETGDPNDLNKEFIELKNIGTQPINLNLAKFTEGIHFTFPDVALAAGQYVIVVADRQAFESEYGTGVNIAGEYTGSLENAGERIRLEDAVGKTILDFEYKDGWRPLTDGEGFSLTIIEPTNPDPNSWGEKESWRASVYWGGSPGEDDSGIIPNPGDVVINEVLAHSHANEPDWIELHNATDQPINIGGWFLSDSDTAPMKYRIAEGTVIDRYGYSIFYENTDFADPNDQGCLEVFRLSENGEKLCLSSASGDVLTGYQEVEDFGASQTAVAFGRYLKKSINTVDFVAMSQNTPGWLNAYPKVGPVIISEIMYNPLSNRDAEFVELHNITGSKVDLFDLEGNTWKLHDADLGIDYNLPANTNIPANGYLLLVKNKNVFQSQYPGVPSGVKIFEWGDGRLDNGGEKIYISMPGDVDGLGQRHYIRVDMINYDNEIPWPLDADGGGASLSRVSESLYGNDPNNWIAANPPTPGK